MCESVWPSRKERSGAADSVGIRDDLDVQPPDRSRARNVFGVTVTGPPYHRGKPRDRRLQLDPQENPLRRLLAVEELADLLQVPVRTIYQWRHRGDGPRPIRVGRYLRYDPVDVAAWLEDQKAVTK